MQWPDITFPPINLWSLPKMNKDVLNSRTKPYPVDKLIYQSTPNYKNDDAFDFTLIDEEDEIEIVDSKVLRELHLKDDFDWENERELEDLYGDFDE